VLSKLSGWFYRAIYALLVKPILEIHARAQGDERSDFDLAEDVLQFNRDAGNTVVRTGIRYIEDANYGATLCEPCKSRNRDAPAVAIVNGIRMCRRHDNAARAVLKEAV
jgi:hypothetical protein